MLFFLSLLRYGETPLHMAATIYGMMHLHHWFYNIDLHFMEFEYEKTMLLWEVLQTHYPRNNYTSIMYWFGITLIYDIEQSNELVIDFLMQQPKLFDGYKFYFIGGFIPSYKGYMQDLMIAAGGIILHRKLVSDDQNSVPRHMCPQVHCNNAYIYHLPAHKNFPLTAN
ncbi:unnamed protein product [Vicia faba]|uniref:Uncharacterized protein n=1 Tax=Vicia faba TaxID=3906 RepID=A0AAV1BAN0_VICFA|nr:unnamed protein product [Vicia faba]